MTRTIIVLLLLATAALLPARAAADWMSDSWHCLDASGYDDCSAGHYFGQWGYTYSALANHHDQALLPYFASTGARLEIQSLAQRLDAILARGQFGVFAPDRYSVEQRGNRTVARPGGLFEILFDCLQCSLFRVWRNGELEYSGTSGSVHRDPGEGTHNYTIELCESGRRGTRCVDSYLTVVVSGDTSEPLLNLAQSAERVIVEPDGGSAPTLGSSGTTRTKCALISKSAGTVFQASCSEVLVQAHA